jgi:hypothetical protein
MKGTVDCAAVASGSADWSSDVGQWIQSGEEIWGCRCDEYDQSEYTAVVGESENVPECPDADSVLLCI